MTSPEQTTKLNLWEAHAHPQFLGYDAPVFLHEAV